MAIQTDIRKLVAYGVSAGLVPTEDIVFTTNRLLELFGLDELEETDKSVTMDASELEEVLGRMCDYAYEKGLMAENTVTYRDLFDTKVMSMKAEILSAAYVRGYAERTGTPEIPKSVRKKRLDDLMDEELVQL